ncbi:hypothetical protein ACRJ4W_03335 [Streptomyces sp. GLT-R25]
MGEQTRAGRPWSPARGSCAETNEVVGMLRSWLGTAGVTVKQLHHRLTSDHFGDGQIPTLRRLRSQLAGEGLAWDLVEAVADVCFPDDDHEAVQQRLEQPRQLWEAAEKAPTATDGSGPQVTAREVLHAQQRALTAYEELNRARQAFEASEHGRQQALQIATILFGMLGQAQAKVVELTRRIDALNHSTPGDPEEVTGLERMRHRAKAQEHQLRTSADPCRQRAADGPDRRRSRGTPDPATGSRTAGTQNENGHWRAGRRHPQPPTARSCYAAGA